MASTSLIGGIVLPLARIPYRTVWPAPNRMLRRGPKAILTVALGILLAGCSANSTGGASTSVKYPTFLPKLSYFKATQIADLSDPHSPTFCAPLSANPNANPNNWTPAIPQQLSNVQLPLPDALSTTIYKNTYPYPTPAGKSSCISAAGVFALTSLSNNDVYVFLTAGTGAAQKNIGNSFNGPSETVLCINAEWQLGSGLFPPPGGLTYQFPVSFILAPGGQDRVIINLTYTDKPATGGAPISAILKRDCTFDSSTTSYDPISGTLPMKGLVGGEGDLFTITGTITFMASGSVSSIGDPPPTN